MNIDSKPIDTKDQLIRTAARMIRESRSTGEITIRKIVAAAGVNLNAVNYHFGSKEHLIREAVRVIIGEYFGRRRMRPGSTGTGIRENLVRICDFLFDEPIAARIALEAELGVQGSGASLTSETQEFFLGLFKLALPELDEGEMRRRIWILLASVHQLVLRPKGCIEWLGADPAKKGKRDILLRHLCSTLGAVEKKE